MFRGLALASVSVLLLLPAMAAQAEEEPGFKSLFNGKDLKGWDGDPKHWSVVEGVIRGDSTVNKAGGNTFLIRRGDTLKNFELKLKFRIATGNNSGVQYRSKDLGKWVVSGYQAEVENKPGKVGFLYHEKGRGWLVDVGDFVIINEAAQRQKFSKVANVEELKKAPYYNDKDWNEYHIIARGNHVLHYLNGYPTMELIDNDRKGRCDEGILALQIHGGSPMTVDYKDIRLKTLDAKYGEAALLFDGKSLDGWTYSSDNQKDVWTVKDGVLHDSGRPPGYLRTKKDYTNFLIRMQVRHLTGGNGGVLVRMIGEDKVWPKSIEAQGMAGHKGTIFIIDKFPCKLDPERSRGRCGPKMHESNEKPMGQWNDYEIEINGGDLRILVNRLLQNTATECQEIPGKICLQSEGSQMEYRNIVLIPIQKGDDAP